MCRPNDIYIYEWSVVEYGKMGNSIQAEIGFTSLRSSLRNIAQSITAR